MTQRLIVIEGNAGVGKSTAATYLEGALDAALYHYPPEFVRFRRAVDMDERVPALANLVYHLGAMLHLVELVKRELETRNVVCDRYLASPISLLAARGRLAPAEIERAFEPFRGSILAPRLTIVVRADHEIVRKRIEARAEAGPLRAIDRWTAESKEFFETRHASLVAWSERLGPTVEIDNSQLAPEETWARIRELAGIGGG